MKKILLTEKQFHLATELLDCPNSWGLINKADCEFFVTDEKCLKCWETAIEQNNKAIENKEIK